MRVLTIRLLGSPEVEDSGRTRQPAGCKTWALLAYLLLAERPPRRATLAALCFPDANDPRAALRWSLTDLRRLLGPRTSVSGDPVELQLPARSVVDLDLVLTGSERAGTVAALGAELLEGLSFSSSAPLELWLDCERQRLAVACRELLHTAADDALRDGDGKELARLAGQLILLDPVGAFEALQSLLVGTGAPVQGAVPG